MIELKGDKFLVTGGAGFIGSHIAEEIVRQGKHVVIVDDLSSGYKEYIAPWWNSDLCVFVNHRLGAPHIDYDLFDGIDVVFHNAASKCTVCRKDPLNDLMVNAWGSFQVFQAAARAGVRKVVHASTGSVNGGRPNSFYGVSKQAGESYLNAFKEYYGLNYTALRYFHVYGPRQESADHGGVIPIFIRKALSGHSPTIFGDGSQERSFTYVKDVVNANFLAASDRLYDGRALNVLSGQWISILHTCLTIINEVGIKNPGPAFEDWRPGDIRKFNAVNEMPIEFTDFETGLAETIRWYRNALA